MDAGDAASRDVWVPAVCGQAASPVVRIPLGQAARLAFGWNGPADQVTDDQIRNASGPRAALPRPCRAGPNKGDLDRLLGQAFSKPTKHRRRNVGQSPVLSESPDAYPCGRPHRHQAQGCIGHPAFRTPSHKGGGNARDDGAPAPPTTGAMTHV